MMKIWPSLNASKGYRGRQLISDVFVKYFENEGLKNGSIFGQSRFASASKHDISLKDIAIFELVNLIGTHQHRPNDHLISPRFALSGGGTTLCPGHHFATTIAMAIKVMFLMRYDIEIVKDPWPQMTADETHAEAAVGASEYEIEVSLKPRKWFEEGDWAFRQDDTDAIFTTAVEDLV